MAAKILIKDNQRKTPEQAGFVRENHLYICKLPLEDDRPCNKTFLRNKEKKLFEQHRREVHYESGPLPSLKPGPAATTTEEEKKTQHAAHQAKYVAKKGREAIKAQQEASKHKKSVEHFGKIFDEKFRQQSDAKKPELCLPGIMTFLHNSLSHKAGHLDDSSACIKTMWDLARNKLILVALTQLCSKTNSPDRITDATLQAYVQHAGLSFGAREESSDW